MSAAYDSLGNQNFDKDYFSQNNLQAELHYAFSKRLNIKALGNLSNYHNGLDEGAFTDAKDYTARNKNNIGAFAMNYHHNDFSWNARVSYQQARRSFVDDSTDISSPYSKYSSGNYTGNTFTVETFGDCKLEKHLQLVLGAQYIRQSTDQHYINISDFGDYFSTLNKDSAKSKQYSLYGSLLLTGLNGFNMEIGGRLNNHSVYGNNGTFTVNPSFNVNKHLKLFLNISSGYKIPTLYQLYSEFGNKNLKPESSITYEFGAQSDLLSQMLSLRAAFFKRDTKNLIIFYTDPTTYLSKYINGSEQNDYGFELEQTLQLGNTGSWSNNLAFVDGKGIQDGKKTSNLFRRPKFTWNSILTMQPVRRFTVSPSIRYVGKRLKGPFDMGPDEMPAYYTIDCFLSYGISHVRFFAEFHNITNQQYFDIVGYNSKRFNMMAGFNFNF
ncbi:MAG: hypothetical protein C5B59_14050 [Bacteroidetes bacterium]|nr:MAG: hypothetical protein C5B59_14050 [Bacteroidota bacterium]